VSIGMAIKLNSIVSGLATTLNSIVFDLAVELGPLEESLGLAAQADTIALGLAGGMVKFFDLTLYTTFWSVRLCIVDHTVILWEDIVFFVFFFKSCWVWLGYQTHRYWVRLPGQTQ